MGGEYFHFEKGVKKQKKGGLIAYKWRPDVVKNLNVHFSIFKYFRVIIQKCLPVYLLIHKRITIIHRFDKTTYFFSILC